MIRIENVLVYDIPPVLTLIGVIVTARVGKSNARKLEVVNSAVNDQTDPSAKSLKDQVHEIHDEVVNK